MVGYVNSLEGIFTYYCHFSHQNQWNPWIGCEAPSSELEDHRFCTDCWEERVEPPGFHDNEFYELMIPNDFCLDQILRKRCDEMSMKSFRWILFLLLVGWNFECFWCICSCKWWNPMVHHLPFRENDSPKKFHSNSPLAKRANLSVPWWWKTEDFLQHARSSQASMICPVCRGEILIPEVDCGWVHNDAGGSELLNEMGIWSWAIFGG